MNAERFNAVWSGPLGHFGVRVADDYVTAIERLPSGSERDADHPLAAETVRQLAAWYEDPTRPFTLPLAPARTPFQRRFRELLVRVPAGAVCTYGELAEQLGSAPRAVGGACRVNPLPLVVPCHRVIAAGGGIGGYGGRWGDGPDVDFKQRLLAHERALAR